MNICSTCGYKAVRNDFFEKHKLTHQVQYSEEIPVVSEPTIQEVVTTEAPVESIVEVPVMEPVTVVTPDILQIPDEITIRFMKPVEIFINAKPYVGKEIKVKDMALASEIVRIAREAYGPTILA